MGTARIEAKWAIILSVITFVLFILYKLFGLQSPENIQTGQFVDMVVSLLLMVFTIWSCIKEKRDAIYNGIMTWSEGFWIGARMTLLAIVIMAFFIVIFCYFINPDYMINWGHMMEEAGAVADDHIYNLNEYLLMHARMGSITALILTAIISFFTKKTAD